MKQTILESNESLQTLANDLSESINRYMKRRIIHLAAVVGLLEDMKFNVMNTARKLKPSERITNRKTDYIG